MTWADGDQPRARLDLGERIIDGEALLVDAQGGQILVLNEMGAMIWQALDGTRTVGALVAGVVAEFDVDEATARHDVEQFLSQLEQRGALVP